MKTFRCDNCGHPLFFENVQCLQCGSALAFLPDRLALKGIYQLMLLTGRVRYPRATDYLAYYCRGRGDTLRFDAAVLLRNPEVQQALRHHKQGITFRHQPPTNPRHHVVSLGKIRFRLNDGLIHVAYPQAKMFVAYGEAKLGSR